MPAYLVALRKVSDPDRMKQYIAKVVPILESLGARYLTGTEGHQVLSGAFHPDRAVLIEFPDMAAIRRWYDSPQYRPLNELRQECGEEILIAIEGK